MRRARRIVSVAVVVAVACVAPSAQPSSTATAVAPATTGAPTARATATPASALAAEIRMPLDADAAPTIADEEALAVTRSTGPRTARIEVRELRGGQTTILRPNADLPQITSLRNGVIAFTESVAGPEPQTERVRVLAGRWRNPGTVIVLDDLLIAVAGGDDLSPWPLPQTNGWEIVWMHGPRGGPLELRMRTADGQIKTIHASRSLFSFALARNGDVAIADIAVAGQLAPVALRLYAGGSLRTILERSPSASGHVRWIGGRIAWTNGLGLVRPIRDLELIEPATAARETVALPPGCSGYTGATDAHVAFACGDHLDLVDAAGPTRVGPPVPLVYPRALIRTESGPPRIVFVTPITTTDPRPGAGARF